MPVDRTLFRPPNFVWDRAIADALTGVDEVVHRAHLVGRDPALVREGGGNFSAKGVTQDQWGRPVRVLWMSGWGCDGGTSTPTHFPALRLDDLRLLRDGGPMSEPEMVRYLVASGLTGEQLRPGIETLTHAFLDAPHVDHTHPDAVIAMTAIPNGRTLAEKEFGDEAIWFDYRQFDVGVARELADRVAANPRCRFILLANHGLFTWGDTSEECYRNSHEAVTRATRVLSAVIDRTPDLGGAVTLPPTPERSAEIWDEVLPVLRRELSVGTSGLVLQVDATAETVAFTTSRRGPELALRGPGCPDHLVTIGFRPLVVTGEVTAETVRRGIERYRREYDAYYDAHISAAGRALPKKSNAPRVVVLPGLGVVAAGADAAKARLGLDHFGQTMAVVRACDAAGGYATLSEELGLADEYWPLMSLKPQLRPPAGPLAGKVVLYRSRGLRVASALAAAGAHLVLVGDPAVTVPAAEAIERVEGEKRAVAVGTATAGSPELIRHAVRTYGGFDLTVEEITSSGAPVSEATLDHFADHRIGGSVVLVDSEPAPDRAQRLLDSLRQRRPAARLRVNAISTGDVDDPEIAGAVTHLTTATWDGVLFRRAER